MISKKNANRDGSKKSSGRKPATRSFKGKTAGAEKKHSHVKKEVSGPEKPFRKDFRSKEEKTDRPLSRSPRTSAGKTDKPYGKKFDSKESGRDKPFREKSFGKDSEKSSEFRSRPYTRKGKDDDTRIERSSGPRSSTGFKKRETGSFSKPERSSSFDKPKRSFSRPDSGSSFDKPKRSYSRPESGSSFDKPKRSFTRPERSSDSERPERTSGAERGSSFDKPKRSFSRTDSGSGFDKPRRSFSRPESGSDGERSERTPRFDKPERSNRRVIERKAPKVNDGRVRLNKIIASSGICSRREADDMIVAGLVTVNGVTITELGSKVNPEEDIRYNGERLKQERLVYIVMNKPKDFVTTTKDPFAKRTVMDLLDGSVKERVFPVGRLDRNTTGVLLITNDGDLAKKLTHPSHNRKKIYHVHLDKNLKGADIESISKGFELEDGFVKADDISFIDPEDKKQVGIEVHSGRNRIVRRIFEHFNYEVTKLDRVYFAGLTKKGMQRGHWRFLTSQEIGMLKMGSYE